MNSGSVFFGEYPPRTQHRIPGKTANDSFKGFSSTTSASLARHLDGCVPLDRRSRSCSISSPSSPNRLFSFDIELPIDCDDEYWPVDGETEGFKQPPGKPSKLTMFILMINLFHLQTDVIRLIVSDSSQDSTLDATHRSNQYPSDRDTSFHDSEEEKRMFGTLDVEMDKWAKSVPGYREFVHSCGPDQQRHDICAVRQLSFEPLADPVFVRQSIYLHTNYHSFRMWVRRPFTLPNRKGSPLAPAATAMCTNSAMACFNLLYKLKPWLGVDLMSYEVFSQAFYQWVPRTDSLGLSGCTICGRFHLPHQYVEPTPLRGCYPRQRVAREVLGIVQDHRVEVPQGELTMVRLSLCLLCSISFDPSTVIEGILYQPRKSPQHSTPTNAATSETPRHPSACVIEGDEGIEYYIGFDRAFTQVTEPVGGVAEEHSNYFAFYQQSTYSVGLR